jgi:hypothetical protein
MIMSDPKSPDTQVKQADDKDKDDENKQFHHELIERFAGKTAKFPLGEWSPDISSAIDKWVLREFDAWSRSKKTVFKIQYVEIHSWYENDYEVDYELTAGHAGALDHDLREHAGIRLIVTRNCGTADDPTSFAFKLGIDTGTQYNFVYTSNGVVLKKAVTPKHKEFKIVGSGTPHCERLGAAKP